jgi:hypothetical protein
MLKLCVTRLWFTDKSTIGMLDIDGVQEAYTLEPVTRADDEKPRAIPVGTYRLALLPSARFETYTPHVLDVPGFTGIEIHPGNSPKDTSGCCLVGQTRGTAETPNDWIGNSDEAFNELIGKLDASEPMQIEYREERALAA